MRLNCLCFSLIIVCSVNLNALSQRLVGKACCMATSNELFSVLMLHPLSIGSDLCYSLQDRKSHSLKFMETLGTIFACLLAVVPVGLLLHFYARHRDKEITLN